MSRLFDHEKLEVYQESLAFISWLEPIVRKLSRKIAVRDPLDRASTSIVLNRAVARGSALECAAGLDVLAAKGFCEVEVVNIGKEKLRRIVSMLVGLIKANSDYRLHEGDGD
jgi:hypothetical protein